MKFLLRFICFLTVFLVTIQLSVAQVSANVCYGSRVVNQYYCSGSGSGPICQFADWRKAGPGVSGPCGGCAGQTCDTTNQGASCNVSDIYGNTYSCMCTCTDWSDSTGSGGTCINSGTNTFACTNEANGCHIDSDTEIRNCGYDSSGLCQDSSTPALNFQCYGPGDPPAVCGNGTCETGETCSSCPTDCTCVPPSPSSSPTFTPTPTPTIPPSGTPTPTPTATPSPTPTPTCTPTGVPAAPTGLNPANGAIITPDAVGNVTFTWNLQGDADHYEVHVFPTGTSATTECTAANTHCTPVPITTNSFGFTLDVGITSYTWKVRAINTFCSGSTLISGWTTSTVTVGSTISGNFYQDDTHASFVDPVTGRCIGPGGLPTQNPDATSSIAGSYGSPATLVPGSIIGSTYSVNPVPAYSAATITFSPNTFAYECVCPAGCAYSVTSPLSDLNYFLSAAREPWWQSRNGLLYANNSVGTAIQSKIPVTCTPAAGCTPALSLKDKAGATYSEGYALSAGGSIDSTYDSGTQYSNLREDTGTGHIQGTTLRAAREDYDYFVSVFSMAIDPQDDITSGGKPGAAPVNGRAYYNNGDLIIDSTWTVAAGESYVIFVNGNLTVNQNITVAEGGFLAFIVKNDITFSSSLGQTVLSSTTPVVEGVYVANGQIIIDSVGGGSGDSKFIGAGSFVGWGGIQMRRQYQPTITNNTFPTDLFIYRPDFMLTLPPRMTKAYQLWQEVSL